MSLLNFLGRIALFNMIFKRLSGNSRSNSQSSVERDIDHSVFNRDISRYHRSSFHDSSYSKAYHRDDDLRSHHHLHDDDFDDHFDSHDFIDDDF